MNSSHFTLLSLTQALHPSASGGTEKGGYLLRVWGNRPMAICGMALLALFALPLFPLQATDGTYTSTSGGAWNVAGSWDSSVIASGSGSTAYFNTLDLTTDISLSLGANQTIGNLIFGDTAPSNHGWTITGNTLTLAGTTPTVTVNDLGTGTATINSIIAGTAGLKKEGSGTLVLGGGNTYTGGTNIGGGTVTLGNATALGAAATAVLNLTGTGTLNLNALSPSLLKLTGTSGTTIQNNGATNSTLTLTPVANSTSSFAGTLQNGSGAGTLGVTVNGTGALSLSGTNTYTGATTLTAGQLNLNSATALGTSVLTLTAGILDNTSGSAVALTNNNNITLGGNFTFGGSNDLSFGTGVLTTTNLNRTLTLMGNSGKTLSIGTYNTSGTSALGTTTVNALPGSNSTLSIGTFNPQASGAGNDQTIAGNGNINITGGITPTIVGAGITYSNTGTLTLTGTSTYTGATRFNAGTFILDNTSGSTTFGNTLVYLNGGTFIYKAPTGGSNQTLGNVTMSSLSGASSIQIVGGTSGTTTLTLGTINFTQNGAMMNLNLSGTGAAVTTTTVNANDNLFGTRGAVTVTTGGTTEFATRNGSNQLVQYTGATALPGGATTATTNYKLSGNATLGQTESVNSLRLTDSGSAGESLDINGKILTITSGGLLYVGTNGYEIKDIAGGGSLKSNTATASDLIIHNFGSGGLTISSVIANGIGASVVSLDGTGTTTLSGINTYTGATTAGGGAVLSIGANSGLGAVATGAALNLNNATLQATNTFALNNAGANSRNVTLNAGGGTFDVTGSNLLTVTGVISGTGSLTKTGTGTLLLSTGVNTYSGGFTQIQNGAMQLGGAAGSIASTNIVVLGSGANSGKLILGDASNTKTQIIAGLTTLGTGTTNAVVGGNAANSTLTYTGTVAVPTTFNGILGGVGTNENNLALNITAGQLTLGGANTYTGGTTVTGGVLNLNSASALGTGNLAITNASAVIDNTSGSAKTMTNNNNVTTTTGFVFGGSNGLNFGSGTLSSNLTATPITLNGSSTLTFGGGLVNNIAAGTALTLTVNGSTGTLSLGGYNMQANTGAAITNVIAGSGNVNITGAITPGAFNANNALSYTGTGVLTLSGTNTYTGTTTVAAGTLSVSNIVVSGSGSNLGNATSAVILGAAATKGTLSYTGNSATYTRGFTLGNGGGKLDVTTSGQTLTVGTGAITGTAGLLTVGGAGNTTITSAITTTTGGLTKTGAGTLTLSNGGNTYTGATQITGGTLIASVLNNGGGTNNSSIGRGTTAATSLILNGGTLQYTGATVSTDRLFSVGTNGGTLDASGSGAVNFAATGAVGFNGETGTRTLTLTGTNADNNTLAAIIANDGSSNATSLVKNGVGKWVLSGANTYTGNTIINAGTLLVNGSLSSASAVQVDVNGTLGGRGSVGAISGAGTVAPGNSPGILTALSVDGSSGMDFAFEIMASAPNYGDAANSLNDVLRLTAGTPFVTALDGDNTVTVDFSSLSLAIGQTYTGGFYTDANVDFASSISGANFVFTGADGFTIAVSTVQQNADFGIGNINGWVTQFDVLAIPEPSTTLLLAGALTALVIFRRRRRA